MTEENFSRQKSAEGFKQIQLGCISSSYCSQPEPPNQGQMKMERGLVYFPPPPPLSRAVKEEVILPAVEQHKIY